MSDPYSLLLASAVAVVSLAVGVALVSRFIPRLRPWSPLAAPAAALALALDAASIVVHWRAGHASGTEAAMSGSDFVAEHPAFLVVALLAIGTLVAVRIWRR